MTLAPEVLKALEASLPVAATSLIQKRLSDADNLEVQLAKARTSLEDALKIIATARERERELSHSLAVAGDLTARAAALDDREKQLEKREVRQELNDLRVVAAADQVKVALHCVGLVFGNNRYKYSETATAPTVIPGVPGFASPTGSYCGGMSGYPGQVVESRTTKTTEGEG